MKSFFLHYKLNVTWEFEPLISFMSSIYYYLFIQPHPLHIWIRYNSIWTHIWTTYKQIIRKQQHCTYWNVIFLINSTFAVRELNDFCGIFVYFTCKFSFYLKEKTLYPQGIPNRKINSKKICKSIPQESCRLVVHCIKIKKNFTFENMGAGWIWTIEF